MNPIRQNARFVFAIGIIGLGVLGFVYGDFASAWPAWVPARQALLYAASAIMVIAGAGLLFARTAPVALRVLMTWFVIWMALRVPALFTAPKVEGNWFAVGETAVLTAGAWLLLTERGALRGARFARMLFAFALIPFGLSHFVYLKETVMFIPSWLPFRSGWAYFTGSAHVAAGLGILFSVVPKLAATMEAIMLSIFTLGVWVPQIIAAPASQNNWGEFVLSWALASAAFIVAGSFADDSAHA